jgi:hypothetical protein
MRDGRTIQVAAIGGEDPGRGPSVPDASHPWPAIIVRIDVSLLRTARPEGAKCLGLSGGFWGHCGLKSQCIEDRGIEDRGSISPKLATLPLQALTIYFAKYGCP